MRTIQRASTNITTLRLADPDYPPQLRVTPHAPDPLYLSGVLPDPGRPTVAIVGTRRCTPYGVRVAHELAYALAAAGAVIVSGLAQGIDSVAHQAAIDAQGSTVAVLGEGLLALDSTRSIRRHRLAKAIRERGAIVSEYALDAVAQTWTFPRRNATIAGLAQAVIVVEAPDSSGALITADRARDLKRPVYVVPGPYGARTWAGSHEYVEERKARLLLGPEPVAEHLGVRLVGTPKPAAELEAPTRRVLDLLAVEPADTDAIAASLGASNEAVATLLAGLLLTGAVVPTGDGRFARAASR